MGTEQLKCKNCGRPVREEWQPPFMEEGFGSYNVYHDDGGDPMFCSEERGDLREAQLERDGN